jgi:hypothetical protein
MIYVVALSEYDQVCYEDQTANRLQESLRVFENLMALPQLQTVTVILILNKMDQFSKKMLNNDLDKYFPDYTGGTDVKQGVKYIRQKFIQILEKPDCIHVPGLYCFEVSLTEVSDVKTILDSLITGRCSPILVNRPDAFGDGPLPDFSRLGL